MDRSSILHWEYEPAEMLHSSVAGLTISMNILKPKGYKKQSYCPIPDGGLPVEGAGEVVEEVWLGPAEVGEPVLLRQEHGVAVPGGGGLVSV